MYGKHTFLPVCAVTVALVACSGNLGSGATPPVSAPAVGGVVPAQSVNSAPLSGRPGSSANVTLVAQTSIAVPATARIALPKAAGFEGTVCLGPATALSFSCDETSVSPAPSTTPSPIPSPSPTADASPASVMITPPPKKWIPNGVHLVTTAYPTNAPSRDDTADDGATNQLVMFELIPSIALTLNGLNAFELTIPKDQASSEHHYALVLFDRDVKPAKATLGLLVTRKKPNLHGTPIAVSSQLTGTKLQFVDDAAPLPLVAKHHYVIVLYSDTVTPTPGPSYPPVAPFPGQALPSALPGTGTTPGALPTPYVSYPTSNASPLTAATPYGLR